VAIEHPDLIECFQGFNVL